MELSLEISEISYYACCVDFSTVYVIVIWQWKRRFTIAYETSIDSVRFLHCQLLPSSWVYCQCGEQRSRWLEIHKCYSGGVAVVSLFYSSISASLTSAPMRHIDDRSDNTELDEDRSEWNIIVKMLSLLLSSWLDSWKRPCDKNARLGVECKAVWEQLILIKSSWSQALTDSGRS